MKLHPIFPFLFMFLLLSAYSPLTFSQDFCKFFYRDSGIQCCKAKKEEYKDFWPKVTTKGLCDCDLLNEEFELAAKGKCLQEKGDSELQADVEACIKVVKGTTEKIKTCIQVAKKKKIITINHCQNRCTFHISRYKKNCLETGNINCGYCLSSKNNDLYSFYISTDTTGYALEDEEEEINYSIERRFYSSFDTDNKGIIKACMEQTKEKFVKAYKEKCKEEIAIQEEDNTTLLCKGDATKSNPGCDEYCEKRAQVYYAEDLAGNKNDSVPYKVLTSDASQLNELVTENVSELSNDIPKRGGEPKDHLGFHLRWWLCKLNECSSYESELKTALDEAVKTCADLQTEAYKCCHEPEKCVGGGLAQALDGLGKLNVGLSAFKGLKKQCEAAQQTFGMYGGMQGMMATQCTRKANKCSSQCSQILEKIAKHFKDACNYNPLSKSAYNSSQHTCDKDFFNKYTKIYHSSNNPKQVSIANVPEECKRTGKEANRRIRDMSTNLGTSLLASVNECKEKEDEWNTTDTGQTSVPPPAPPPGSPAPQIADPSLTLGGGGNSKEEEGDPFPGDPSVQLAANPFDIEPDLGELANEGGKGIQKGLGSLLGGSSGGGGGGLGPGGGGGPASRGGSHGGSSGGKKRKILLGYKGGKFAGYGGGGSSGESRAERGKFFKSKKDKRGMASLDLKKLLPKGKQLNHKISKYGSPHDNIFQRLSDRFQWMCRTNKISCK